MKTYLKRLLIPILSGLIVCSFYSCNSDDEHTATPIAPKNNGNAICKPLFIIFFNRVRSKRL